MRMKLLLAGLLLICCGAVKAGQYQVVSIDGRTRLTIWADKTLSWQIDKNDKPVLRRSAMGMNLSSGRRIGTDCKVVDAKSETVFDTIKPVVRESGSEIDNSYNKLMIKCQGGWSVEFRVFNDAAAYRFITDFEDRVEILSERFELNFPGGEKIYFPKEDSFYSHSERYYQYRDVASIKPDEFCSLPAVVEIKDGSRVAVAESDLEDYPGLYLAGSSGGSLKGVLPAAPSEFEKKSDRDQLVRKRYDFIAKTAGTRTFPWRILVIADDDSQLVASEAVYKLADECVLDDTSWIRPGKVAWDWYNANNVFGVDFRAGVNTETYKYYIDFASKYGIEYIILDEGWYKLGDLLAVNKDIDMPELLKYARQRGVGIILWTTWLTLNEQFEEAMDMFSVWGIAGIKVDFMQRDDQVMVNYYTKVARAAAERKMLVDFHGSYKPAGLRRKYPNVITREGVRGGEQHKWSSECDPEHNVTLPFIRMLAGPMDYTPGSMTNAQKANHRGIFTRPMSLGTRCHQLAMYVVYESPLQMLCDSPSQYYRQAECMEFLAEVPSVWDQTVVLDGKIADYVAVARRSGETWYVGAMTDWTARELEIDTSFLKEGKWRVKSWADGVNADRYAEDYKVKVDLVDAGSKIKVRLAPGGGWAAVFKRAE